MGKFLIYALIVIGASSMMNWTTLGRSSSAYYGGSRGGFFGVPGGGFGSGGSGHK